MDEHMLREILGRATWPEPPIGPLARNSLRAGIRLRRRRRIQITACAAVAACAFAAAPAITGEHHSPATTSHRGTTAYVVAGFHKVVPINLATHKVGSPIPIAGSRRGGGTAAITPDGRTIYVINGGGRGVITPIDTATRKAGKLIKVPGNPDSIAITPNGKTAYVPNFYGVVPVEISTGKVLKPIHSFYAEDIAITPNGKTVYAVNVNVGTLTPIRTATNKALKPIKLGNTGMAWSVAITPDGKMAYVVTNEAVVPVRTATNTALRPIRIRSSGYGSVANLVISPSGQTVYAATTSGIIPISTATNTAGKPITSSGLAQQGVSLVITRNGRTLYAATGDAVVPVSTATNTAGRPIHVGALTGDLAISPDGKTVFAGINGGASANFVIPINVATARAGNRIYVAGTPFEMVFGP